MPGPGSGRRRGQHPPPPPCPGIGFLPTQEITTNQQFKMTHIYHHRFLWVRSPSSAQLAPRRVPQAMTQVTAAGPPTPLQTWLGKELLLSLQGV